jgi:hypothetical protein
MIDKLPEAQLDANAFWPAQHTHTRECDGLHPPGPCPGLAGLRMEVSKLDVMPGDRIVVTVHGKLTAQLAEEVSSRVRDILGVPVRVVIVDDTVEFKVETA